MTAIGTTTVKFERDEPNCGWVFYDGECSFCIAAATRFAPLLRRYDFRCLPLQTPWVRERLGLVAGKPLLEMKLLTVGGDIFGGAEALLQIARNIWWAWPLFMLSFLPGVRLFLNAGYRQVAARRNCFGGECVIKRPPQSQILDWILLFILPATAWFLTKPAWVTTWSLALALCLGFKWAVWRKAERRLGRGNFAHLAAFFSWPGMDAEVFLKGDQKPCAVPRFKWLMAVLKIGFGAAVVWFGARLFIPAEPLMAGWVGMIGLVFVLHFGIFDLLGLVWQRAGFAVDPIMRAPVLSQSLGEFWGQRWNLAFSQIAHDFILLPTRRKLGIKGALFVTFAASGLIHELVISIPARGGYGLPTMYFLIQGCGILFERTAYARRIGLGRSWLNTAVFTVGPAFWLFPPPFVRNVILPTLRALGAI